MELADKRCKPCEGGVQPLTREQCMEVLKVLHRNKSEQLVVI